MPMITEQERIQGRESRKKILRERSCRAKVQSGAEVCWKGDGDIVAVADSLGFGPAPMKRLVTGQLGVTLTLPDSSLISRSDCLQQGHSLTTICEGV